MNFDRTVGIHNTNMDCKWLMTAVYQNTI